MHLHVCLYSRLYISREQGLQLSCSSVSLCFPSAQDGVRETIGEVLINVKWIHGWNTVVGHFVGRQCPLFCDEPIYFHFVFLVSQYLWVAYPVPDTVRQTWSCPHTAYTLERDRQPASYYTGDEDRMWHVDQEAWSGLEVEWKPQEEMKFKLISKGS